jgi:uncharacterized protein (DUF427 family)
MSDDATRDIATWKGFEGPPPTVMPSPRWVRVKAGETVIADSRRAQLLAWYGPGRLPTYCFPEADVRTDVLQPAAEGEGEGFLAPYDVLTGDLTVFGGATRFRGVPDDLAALEAHWTFAWDTGLTWLEESTEVHVHARDPSKRVDVVPSERHVEVMIDGQLVASSHRPNALFETWLPTRWYLPPEDVRQDLLVPTTTATRCPYKGTARYWSVLVGDKEHRDIVWSYPDPIPECPGVRGLLCFFNEKVDLIIDGEPQPRPLSPWS